MRDLDRRGRSRGPTWFSRDGLQRAGRGALGAVGLGIVVVLALGCAGPVGTSRTLASDVDLAAKVDSAEARTLLADLRARRAADSALATLAPATQLRVDLIDSPAPEPVPDQAWLRDLGQRVSVDFAALTFARAVGGGRSRAVQVAFDRFVKDPVERASDLLRDPRAFPYRVLFAPAWLYVSHPKKGADFAHARQVLDRLGIPTHLIASGESDSVEDNAVAIAAAVRASTRDGRPSIVVSASKSGAEVALALTRILAPEETASIAAWVNVVGALGGSPLADIAGQPPTSWIARGIFWFKGWNWAGLTSMQTEPSRKRLAGARMPEAIAVVNVIAVTLSRSVGDILYPSYHFMLSQGPNDGVVLLTDTVWPGGANIAVLGADHLLELREYDAQVLALMRAVDLAIRWHGGADEPTAIGLPCID
jgi:hypothetical protein